MEELPQRPRVGWNRGKGPLFISFFFFKKKKLVQRSEACNGFAQDVFRRPIASPISSPLSFSFPSPLSLFLYARLRRITEPRRPQQPSGGLDGHHQPFYLLPPSFHSLSFSFTFFLTLFLLAFRIKNLSRTSWPPV